MTELGAQTIKENLQIKCAHFCQTNKKNGIDGAIRIARQLNEKLCLNVSKHVIQMAMEYKTTALGLNCVTIQKAGVSPSSSRQEVI